MKASGTDGFEEKVNARMTMWRPPFSEDSAERAKRSVNARIDHASLPRDAEVVRLRRRLSTPLAAAVLLFLVGLPFFVWLAGEERLENTANTVLSHALPGGSNVAIAPGAAVSFNAWLWPVSRHVKLSGEAFFEVVPGRPFKVITDGAEVAVKGTSFSVWAAPSRTFVHCLSGKVEVRRGQASATLTSGTAVRAEAGETALTAAQFSHKGPFLPARSLLNFDEVPLCVVVSVLEQVFDADIVSGVAPELLYSGDLTGKTRDECLDILARTFSLSLRFTDESIILMP